MEEVLVIPKSCLPSHLINSQIYPMKESMIIELIKNFGFFVRRDFAEKDFNHYQIIPYIVIKRDNQFFCTKRTNKQSEQRLHDKRSLGVGGHLNPSDGDLRMIVKTGMERELKEELWPFSQKALSFLGVLVDFSTEVSLVHLGLVYLVETNDEVTVKETEKMQGEWVFLQDLHQEKIHLTLETWSQIVLKYIK